MFITPFYPNLSYLHLKIIMFIDRYSIDTYFNLKRCQRSVYVIRINLEFLALLYETNYKTQSLDRGAIWGGAGCALAHPEFFSSTIICYWPRRH